MYFPIGDIHGAYNVTKKLYDEIVKRVGEGIDPVYGGTIVFLGDYIDRGPDSKKVLDFLMELDKNGPYEVNGHTVDHKFLLGNHEEFFINCRRDPRDVISARTWLIYGGEETLESFECELEDVMTGKLDRYVRWLEDLPRIITDPDYVFVHATVNPLIPLSKQKTQDWLLWDFDWDYKVYRNMSKIVVHGHMARDEGPIVDFENNRVWMDVYASKTGRHCTIGLPQPYPYEPFKLTVIEART